MIRQGVRSIWYGDFGGGVGVGVGFVPVGKW